MSEDSTNRMIGFPAAEQDRSTDHHGLRTGQLRGFVAFLSLLTSVAAALPAAAAEKSPITPVAFTLPSPAAAQLLPSSPAVRNGDGLAFINDQPLGIVLLDQQRAGGISPAVPAIGPGVIMARVILWDEVNPKSQANQAAGTSYTSTIQIR